MAKFKVGDRCEFNGVKGVIKRVKEGKGGFLTGYVFKGDDGEMYEPAEPQLKRIANSSSTNPVVQNALAATVARNADGERARSFYAAAARNIAAARQELLKANDNLNRAVSEDDSQVSASVGTQHAKWTKEAFEILSRVSKGLKAG